MSLANGRHYLAIPGPSVVPDRVLAAMHRASPNIYAGELVDMVPGIYADLKRVACCTANLAIYMSNGHGGWEAVNANMFSRGDKALVASNGRFGTTWAEAARQIGVDVHFLDFGNRGSVDIAKIGEALAADRDHTIRAVLVTHVDTASSARNDIKALRAVINSTGHPALLAVDAIASLGCDELQFDEWGIDVLVSASQKGIMLPPGLSFVWFSEKAKEASLRSDLVTPYWNWHTRAVEAEFYRRFAGTAPTQMLFGLRESLTMILDEGLENIWARHRALASAVWTAFDAWGKEGDIGANVADVASRSHAVTAAHIGNGGATRLRTWLEANAGVTLGIGLGMALATEPAYHDYLRVAHMGHVNAHMTLGVLASMEAGMRALDIPHGSGAIDAAAAAIARHFKASDKS